MPTLRDYRRHRWSEIFPGGRGAACSGWRNSPKCGLRQRQRIRDRFPWPKSDVRLAECWSSKIEAARLAACYLPPELAVVLENTAGLRCMRISTMLEILLTVSTNVSALLELLRYLG